MNTDVEPTQTPEERELAKKLAELDELEAALADPQGVRDQSHAARRSQPQCLSGAVQDSDLKARRQMKRVAEIRRDLGAIPGVFYDHEPGETERGTQGAVQTLWDREASGETAGQSLADEPQLFEEESNSTVHTGAELDDLFEIGAEIDEDRLREALGDGLGERIRKSIEVRGVDALGWYVTFHARGAQWGIYIKSSSVLGLAQMFGHMATDLETRLRIAFRAIHQHELFHFATDYMSAQWELITGQPCHQPARALRDRTAGYILVEEALANANMVRSCQRGRKLLRVRGRAKALRAFTALQPAGYRDAHRYVSTHAFVDGCERLARNYLGCVPDYSRGDIPSLDLMGLYPQWPQLDWCYCPVHVIDDTPHLNLPPFKIDLFRTVEGIEENREFRSSLAAASARTQQAWAKVKQQLAVTTAPAVSTSRRGSVAVTPSSTQCDSTGTFEPISSATSAQVVGLRWRSVHIPGWDTTEPWRARSESQVASELRLPNANARQTGLR